MPTRTITVASAHGLHARPAAEFTKAAAAAGTPVELVKGERTVNAASILGVISLGIEHGDQVVVSAEGDGAEAVLDELERVLTTDFDA